MSIYALLRLLNVRDTSAECAESPPVKPRATLRSDAEHVLFNDTRDLIQRILTTQRSFRESKTHVTYHSITCSQKWRSRRRLDAPQTQPRLCPKHTTTASSSANDPPTGRYYRKQVLIAAASICLHSHA
jgi:hypothetical protein